MFDLIEVTEDSVRECADALVSSVVEQRRVAATRLARVAQWADQHPPESVTGVGRWRTVVGGPEGAPAGRVFVRGKSRAVAMQVGGDGTPLVSEYAVVELGVLLQTTTGSAMALMRDVLDLRHRLPSVWAAVLTGEVEEGKARKAACVTRPLSFEQARRVDTEILDALVGLPYGRAVDVIEGRVIAADPAAHEERRQAEAARRYVAVGRRPNPAGLRTLVAQTSAGDVARFDAMVDHVARLLGEHGDTDPLQVRRAKALGILADPALACQLIAGLPEQPDRPEPSAEEAAVTRAATWGEALRSLGTKALDRLRPRTVLHFHLGEEALVARSNHGPVGLAQLEEWLGRDRVVIRPVIDLHGQISVDAYETPDRIAEHLHLREPFEVFPFGTLPAPGADLDHTVPYVPPDEGGPPGQTSTTNLGPLGRRHHNSKTHGGFRCHQPLPGLYLWQTPAGQWFQVDHTGSHHLGRDTPEIVRQVTARTAARSRVELTWGNTLVAA